MSIVLMEMDGLLFCATNPDQLDVICSIERENREFVFQWTRERHMEAIKCEDEMHISIIDAAANELIGYILLAGISGEDRSLEFRRMAVAVKGKGYGRAGVRFIKKFCFEELKYHRLWLDVYTDNQRAIELYRSEGFVQEGLLRECKKQGDKYRSMIIMSMLEDEYEGIKGGC